MDAITVLGAMKVYKRVAKSAILATAFAAPNILAVQAENDHRILEKYPIYASALRNGETPENAAALLISDIITTEDVLASDSASEEELKAERDWLT
jgi:hypothetical protein